MSLACTLAALALGATVTVRLEGVRNTNGTVHLALFRTADGFPEDNSRAARTISVKAAPVITVELDLEPGEWALSVLHDENENGKLDRTLGIPKEGVAASNHPRGLKGLPSFDESRFLVRGGALSMTLPMSYWL